MEIEEEVTKEETLEETGEKELVADLANEQSEDVGEKQNNFLESTLGKVINTGVDIALRAVLPDVVEDEIIRN